MIPETEVFSDLIGAIYDTTLDRDLWPDVLRKSAEFVGGSAATIFSKNPTVGNGSIFYEFGTDPHYRQLYFDKYVKLDPATTGHYFADIGQPIATADLLPYGEFLETRFYKEWAHPQGLVDFVSAVLDKSVTSAAMFGVFRHERDGIVDEETRGRNAAHHSAHSPGGADWQRAGLQHVGGDGIRRCVEWPRCRCLSRR